MAICFWDFLGVTVIRSGVTPRDDSRSFTAALKTRHNFQLSIPSYVFKMILVVFEILGHSSFFGSLPGTLSVSISHLTRGEYSVVIFHFQPLPGHTGHPRPGVVMQPRVVVTRSQRFLLKCRGCVWAAHANTQMYFLLSSINDFKSHIKIILKVLRTYTFSMMTPDLKPHRYPW